jgi:uncharacterized protein YjiS (DUF1127 family)
MHTISHRQNDGFLFRAALAALSVAELLVALVWRAAVLLITWQERARERRRLASLDEHMLRDIGLSRGEIHREIGKPFWQA